EVEPEREEKQDGAERGRARVLAEARDEAVGLRRQHVKGAADQLRVPEVLEDVDRGREDRGAEARARERKRHGPADPPGTRAEVMSALLHPRLAPRKRIGHELARECTAS